MAEWRPIPSAPGYEASAEGSIRNARTGRVLRPAVMSRGYLKVHLGRSRQALVHRLVCEAFHGTPAPAHHADHLDFDKTNNRATNLRWLAAHLNSGRQVRWGRAGWEVEGDEAPEGYAPMTDAERAEAEQAVAVEGW